MLRSEEGGGEPGGPIPAVLRARDGAARLQDQGERAGPEAARHRALLARVAQLVVVRVGLDGARDHEGAGAVQEAEAPDVERPEVEAGAALEDPLGHDGARPAAGGDAVEEAGGDEEIVELRDRKSTRLNSRH